MPVLIAPDGTFLGNLSANTFDPNSVSNPYGQYGSQFSSTSVQNQFSQYGSQFSPQSATNPYATSAPRIVDSCTGKYLGQLSKNQFAPDSTGNQFGRYGSPFSPDSINNPFGTYGNTFGSASTTNPFAVGPAAISTPAQPSLTLAAPAFGGTAMQSGLDPTIPLAVATPRIQSPFEMYATVLRLRALQLENQRRALEIEQLKRATTTFVNVPTPRATSTSTATLKTTPVGAAAEGYSTEQTRGLFGAPSLVQRNPDGSETWYYDTATGTKKVHFVGSRTTPTPPAVPTRESAAPPPPAVAPATADLKRSPAAKPPSKTRVANSRTQAATNAKPSTRAFTDACARDASGARPQQLIAGVMTPVFIQPRVLPTPLATLNIGTAVPVVDVEGQWFLIRFDDGRWGSRVGYVSCADVMAGR